MASLIPGFLRRAVEGAQTPIVSWLVAAGVRPNAITTVGTLVLVGSAVAFAGGWIQLGGGLLLLSGVFDMLDGRVARTGGGVTKFGAFYDSTLDRVGEAALFGGIIVYFARTATSPEWTIIAVSVTVVALSAGLIVSYARARAEGLGLDCKVGIAQRAERILGLGIPSLFFGAGPQGMLLFIVVAVLAAVAVITVVQRIMYVRKTADGPPARQTQVRRPLAAVADLSQKGRRGD